MPTVVQLLTILINLLTFLFVARFIAQLLDQRLSNPITRTLMEITDPILAPVRRILPPTGTIDFSPMIVLLLLFVLRRVLASY